MKWEEEDEDSKTLLQKSLAADVVGVMMNIVGNDGAVHDGDADDNVVAVAVVVALLVYGWMFVATIDKILYEQVHVVVADCQILFSLLLLHFPHFLLLLALAPPKLCLLVLVLPSVIHPLPPRPPGGPRQQVGVWGSLVEAP